MPFPRPRPLRFRLVAAFLAISFVAAVLLAAAETYFRCCAPPLASARDIHPDPSLGWDSTPAVTPLTANAGGRRNVYFVGDSFTQGRQWPSIAQRELARRGTAVDGYVLGVSGFGTTQEWLKIERHFDEHRPALVVLQFFAWNDLRDDVAHPPIAYSPTVFDRPFLTLDGRRATLLMPDVPSRFVHAVTSTQVWRRVFFKAVAHLDDYLARADVNALARWHFAGPIDYTERATWEPFYRGDIPEGVYVRSAYAATREAFRRLKMFLDARGSRLLVVALDNPFTVDDDVKAQWIRSQVPMDLGRPLQRIGAMLHEDGITFVDARPALLALARRSGRKVYNPPPGELSGHLEPEGEEVFGREAAGAMLPLLTASR